MNKSSILSIYGDTDFKQSVKISGESKAVKITGLQLCIENELLFRYYDKIKYEKKRWFFDIVSSLINNIINIGR